MQAFCTTKINAQGFAQSLGIYCNAKT